MTRRDQVKKLMGLGAVAAISATEIEASADVNAGAPEVVAVIVSVVGSESVGINYQAINASGESIGGNVAITSFSRVQIEAAIKASVIAVFDGIGKTYTADQILVLL